jgi:3-hydroxybutyryl-CoA dehydrogenase
MKVIVVANAEQREEILLKKVNHNVEMAFVTKYSEIEINDTHDVVFHLNENMDNYEFSDKPVFINAVTDTLKEKKLPANFSRLNGWPGFLKRTAWEMAAGDKGTAFKIFKKLGWDVFFVKDEPGLVSARVISMIINEAFFALEENISSVEEIDLAMKLGTNYPYGPFEWAEKIGLRNIYGLLHKLSRTDKRYLPATLLEKQYFELSSS